MPTMSQSVQTEILARQLKRDEEAREALSKEPSKVWSFTLGVLPLLLQAFFGRQVEQYLGVPAPAAWFLVLTLAALVFLMGEVAVLRRQVKALHYLHTRSDALYLPDEGP